MDAASDEKIMKLLFEIEHLQRTLSQERQEHVEQLKDLQVSIIRSIRILANRLFKWYIFGPRYKNLCYFLIQTKIAEKFWNYCWNGVILEIKTSNC